MPKSTLIYRSVAIGEFAYYLKNQTLMSAPISDNNEILEEQEWRVETIDSDILFRIEKKLGFDFNHNRIYIK